MAKKTEALAILGCAELVAARGVAASIRRRNHDRLAEIFADIDSPHDRLERVFALYRQSGLETAAAVQDAVLEILAKGETNHVYEGICVLGGLTPGDILELEKVLKSAQERSLLMMGLPTRITASHSSVTGEMIYKGQQTVEAVPGDELSDADLAPPDFPVEGEVVTATDGNDDH